MALRGLLVDDLGALERYRDQWDDLAVTAARPFCAPAWMLAWWHHVSSPGAQLRVVLVLEGTELVAVAPFFVERRYLGPSTYRLLASRSSHRVEPVVRRGTAPAAVAAVVAHMLAECEPTPDVVSLESIDTSVEWPALLLRGWPGADRSWCRQEWSEEAPTVTLEGLTFDTWMAAKSRNFRSQAGRMRRRLELQGARFLMASTEGELERGLSELARLHHARWRGRGGSVSLDQRVEHMLAHAGRELLPAGRFRLLTIEVGGDVICAQVFVAAGGEVSYWNGGFDERWAADQPAMRALIAAVQDAFERSDRRLDLGGGAHPYKYRLADSQDRLESLLVVPRGNARTRALLAPRHIRRTVSSRLPEPARARLRQLQRQVTRRPVPR